MPIDLTKSEIEVLVDRINQVNFTNIDYRTIEVGVPNVVSTGGPNTSITVTGKPNSGINGSAVLRYNRKNIDLVIGSKNKTFTKDAAVTTKDLVPKINIEYGINLGEEDVVDVALPAFPTNAPNQTITFTLNISPGSLLYAGNVILTLRSNDVNLSDIITHLDLGNIT